MLTDSQHLYIFLSSCSGSWRNTVFIAVQDRPGYLLSTGRDGQPIVMAVEKFQQLTGEQIDPTECCGQLTEASFSALYAQYLLWRLPGAEEDPLHYLSKVFQ